MEPPSKKSRSEEPPQASRYESVIGSIVSQIPAILAEMDAKRSQAMNRNEIEIEVRVGMLVAQNKRLHSRDQNRNAMMVDPSLKSSFNVVFESGLDESLSRKVRQKLPTLGFETKATTTMLYCQGNDRYEKVDGGYRRVDKKDKLSVYDLGLTSHDYDLRICIAREEPSDARTGIVSALEWEISRKKERFSYTHKMRDFWRVDLTQVQSTNKLDGKVSNEMELEFELSSKVQQEWLNERNPEQAHKLVSRIISELLGLLDLCIPSESETGPLPLTLLTGKELLGPWEAAVCDMNDTMVGAKMIKMGQSRKMEFLGSMPVNLFRKNLSIVLETDYFLTEKTDGTRYLLYCTPLGAVLLDRSRALFTFPGAESMTALGATVLDGELVYNLTLHAHVFMVFDVLLYQGEVMINKPFTQRLHCIVHFIFPAYEQAQRTSSGTVQSAVHLLAKRFYQKADFPRLLSKISDSHGIRLYRDGSFHHYTDGIIFQPDAPYVHGRHYDLLKWKWADLRTVDLIADCASTQDVGFYCTGPNESLIHCSKRGDRNVGVGRFDEYRLRKEAQDATTRGKTRSVAEVAYDVDLGMWVFKKVRKDKTEPNYIDSVLGVFMEQAEAIGREELEYALLGATVKLENDFALHLVKSKTKVVDWQRDRVKKASGERK